MPTSTYTPLANITVGASATSVTFSSISQSYKDLIVVINTRTSSFVSADLKLNNDAGANYSQVAMYGTGSSTGFSNWSGGNSAMFLYTPTFVQNEIGVLHIMDYSATNKHKTVLRRSGEGNEDATAGLYRWASNTAVNGLYFTAAGGTFGVSTTFALYGIAG